MQASVAVLPDPTTTILTRCNVEPGEAIDGEDAGAVSDTERWRLLRRNTRCQVVRVDDSATLGHLEALARDAGDDGAVSDVLAVGKELDLVQLDHRSSIRA